MIFVFLLLISCNNTLFSMGTNVDYIPLVPLNAPQSDVAPSIDQPAVPTTVSSKEQNEVENAVAKLAQDYKSNYIDPEKFIDDLIKTLGESNIHDTNNTDFVSVISKKLAIGVIGLARVAQCLYSKPESFKWKTSILHIIVEYLSDRYLKVKPLIFKEALNCLEPTFRLSMIKKILSKSKYFHEAFITHDKLTLEQAEMLLVLNTAMLDKSYKFIPRTQLSSLFSEDTVKEIEKYTDYQIYVSETRGKNSSDSECCPGCNIL